MITEQDLQTVFAVQNRAEAVANKWVKVKHEGYYARTVTINYPSRTISFEIVPVTSGVFYHPKHSISLSFVLDDSDLIQNAIDWYDKETRAKIDLKNKLAELENSDDVKAYLKLQRGTTNFVSYIS